MMLLIAIKLQRVSGYSTLCAGRWGAQDISLRVFNEPHGLRAPGESAEPVSGSSAGLLRLQRCRNRNIRSKPRPQGTRGKGSLGMTPQNMSIHDL